jgi:hypothetical protein
MKTRTRKTNHHNTTTMYKRIQQMTKKEMEQFIHFVYLCGNRDGIKGLEDSPNGFFGAEILSKKASEIMPNDSTDDLWHTFENIWGN